MKHSEDVILTHYSKWRSMLWLTAEERSVKRA